MNPPAGELVIRPLFYDVLNDGFQPESDIQRRTHKVGRLAFATFAQGDVSISEDMFVASYIPSWAKNVQAVVGGMVLPECNLYRLDNIVLRSQHGTLGLYDQVTVEGQQQFELLHPNGSSVITPLQLGSDLNFAAERVRTAAQTFFDQAYRQS